MLTISPRVRATLFVAVAWGLAWSAAGLLVGLVLAAGGWDPLHLAPPAGALRAAAAQGSGMATVGLTLGGLTGLTFAGILSRAERRRGVDALAGRRLVVWVALAGVAWQAAWLTATAPWAGAGARGAAGTAAVLAVVTALFGASSGWLTLRLVRGEVPVTPTGGAPPPVDDPRDLAAGARAGTPRAAARAPVA